MDRSKVENREAATERRLNELEAALKAIKPGDAAGLARMARRLRQSGAEAGITFNELDAEERKAMELYEESARGRLPDVRGSP